MTHRFEEVAIGSVADLLARIRENAEEFKKTDKFTPILMLTTESREDVGLESKKIGASAWVLKPFHPDKLLQTVQRVLK